MLESVPSTIVCIDVSSPNPVAPGCPLDYSFTVNLTTIPGSAGIHLRVPLSDSMYMMCITFTEPGSDYRPGPILILFGPCTTRSCTPIMIVDDSTVEPLTETFTLSLERPSTPLVGVAPESSTLRIADNDCELIKQGS